jgi:hypothetical protein
MARSPYRKSVFINCPFDDEYTPLFDALVFAIHDCGFVARCALEIDDSGQVRAEKIFDLIGSCKFGIHDISRTDLDPANNLPRFNMPLELGLFLGSRRFGGRTQKEKVCLILDSDRYRYQMFCSDIAGQDVKEHKDDPLLAIKVVRNWLQTSLSGTGIRIPSGNRMVGRYQLFLSELPILCNIVALDIDELLFNEYTDLVVGWLKVNS